MMPHMIPITELRKTNEISDTCDKKQIDSAIMEAEREVQAGAKLLDAREALAGLRRKL